MNIIEFFKQKDKKAHLFVSFLIATIIYLIFWWLSSDFLVSMVASFTCSLGVGIGKEYGDDKSPNNKWNWWDILADIIGALLGSIWLFWIIWI